MLEVGEVQADKRSEIKSARMYFFMFSSSPGISLVSGAKVAPLHINN
jgi:hypothetical protein